MLRNQWFAIERSSVIRTRPVALRRLGRPLVLWRDADAVLHGSFDACPHRGAALSRGRVVDGCLECPYHGLRFGPDGVCTEVPAHPDLDPSPWRLHPLVLREHRGLVWWWHGEDEPGPLPWGDDLQERLDASSPTQLDITDTFEVPWLRIMENLTDIHHLPFVHRWTVPVPSAEVTAYTAERRGDDLIVRGSLGDLEASMHLRGPCFGILDFGVAAFAVCVTPIDEEHTWLFARYGQRVIQLPLLRPVATWLLGTFDYRLLQRFQDLPTWQSQRLPDPADIGRYRLFAADEGVRLYFEAYGEWSCR